MIVDLRIYTCKPGKLAAFVKLYHELAWPLQEKHLGKCLGWYTAAEGALNTVVHLWGYESQGDREKRRAAMLADPAWQTYMKASEEAGYLVAQENRILAPTAFSPVQ
jgi:hypothetical protein